MKNWAQKRNKRVKNTCMDHVLKKMQDNLMRVRERERQREKSYSLNKRENRFTQKLFIETFIEFKRKAVDDLTNHNICFSLKLLE